MGKLHPNKTVMAVIPARLGSEEVHAKVLKIIGGKSVIQHVFEKVQEANCFDKILIAADHEKIIDAAKSFGANAVLTKQSHICGSDRAAEAAANQTADIVVNVQADEPFLNPKMLPEVIAPLLEDNDFDMSTLCCEFQSEEAMKFIFNVKVVRSSYSHRALYFSRSVIPYARKTGILPIYQHIGVYAFRKPALIKYSQLGASALELREGLEQLRALENGFKIKVVESKQQYDRIAINTAQDLEQAQKLMEQRQHKN